MQQLEQKEYTKQQVMDALHAKYQPRVIKFRYDLLDKNEVKKAELTTVESAEVSMSAFADIKRTARFKIKDDSIIDWLSDRIQPFFMLQMPDKQWIEWSLGIFLLSSPTKTERNKRIVREIEAYDGLQVLKDDKFDSRYVIKKDINYITAITQILTSAGISKINIDGSLDTLKRDREWETGTEKLKAINELLNDMNYTSLWVDENGYYTATKYKSPSLRGADYTYKDDELSIIFNGVQEELDLFSVANKWVVVQSNAETAPLTSSYTNSNPDNLTSTTSRGRTIVDYRTIDNIASQQALDEYVRRIAFEASQIYGHITFETALMPMHSYSDVLQLQYSPLGISDNYSETNWTMQLQTGGKMKHEVRKVVRI